MTSPAAAFPPRRPAISDRLLGNASLACLALMLVLPFQMWTKKVPVTSFHAEALTAALGLAAMTFALPLWRPSGVPRGSWLPLGFVALLLLQIAVHAVPYRQVALLAALYLLWCVALIVLVRRLREALGLDHVVVALAWGLTLGATLSALIGMAQWVEYYGWFGRYIVAPSATRVWANLAQPNHLADYLALGLASASFLFARRQMSALLAVPLTCLLAHVLVLTGSRAAVLYLVGFVALAVYQRWRSDGDWRRRLLRISLFALAVFLLLPYALEYWFPDAVSLDITGLGRLDAGLHGEARLGLWAGAWRMFEAAPVLGQGFRQFAYQYFTLGPELPAPHVTGFNDHAHNLVLHVAAEFGAIGLAVLCVGAVAWLSGLLRLRQQAAGWWLLALGTVLAVHSMLEYPLWYLYFLGVAALLLGLGEDGAIQSPAPAARPRLVLVAMVLALGWFVLGQLVRDYRTLEALSVFREREVSAEDLASARARERLLEIRRTSLLAPFVDLALARTIRLDRDGLADKLAVNSLAMRMFPVDDTVYRQAILLAMRGDPAGALAQWDRAVKAFPGYEAEARATLIRVRPLAGGGVDPLLQHSAPLRSAAARTH